MPRDTKKRRLAKLTRPRIRGILPRPRLFELIDQRRESPVVWIVGPPGAGKTSLLSSYLEAGKLRDLWYEVDAGDADPATFFYYLQQAGAGFAAGSKNPLPLLTPEYLPDLPGFVRRFFQNLCARLPNPSVLVFENYHEVAADSSFHAVMAQAFAQLPEGINAIVTSRTGPPPQFSRHVANRLIAQIDYGDLRLTLDETGAVAAGKQGFAKEGVHALYEQADGWAAGTILMLERMKRTGEFNFIARTETMDTVFGYFAGQIFGDLPPAAREILLQTSFFPQITVKMAVELTGDGDAGSVLDYLYQRQLFTERRVGDDITYRYHALFRAFLQAKAAERYKPSGTAKMRRRAAQLLEAAGNFDDAILLYQQVSDWDASTALILRQAPLLLARGRQQTLRNWIEATPVEILDAEPWLLCNLGLCHMATDLHKGRSTIERAFGLMLERQDLLGQVMAATGIVETYYLEWADFTPLDRWIVELERLLVLDLAFPSREVELRLNCGMLMAALIRQPRSHMLEVSARRVMELIVEGVQINLAVVAGSFLLHYYTRFDVEASDRVVAFIQPLLNHRDLTPMSQMLWLSRYARHCGFYAGRFDEVAACFSQARALLDKAGLHYYDAALRWDELLMTMTDNDVPFIQTLIAKIEQKIDPARRIDIALLHLGKSRIAIGHGDVSQAAAHARTALENLEKAGATVIRTVCFFFLMEAASEQHDAAAVRAGLKAWRLSLPHGAVALVEYMTSIHEGRIAADEGNLEEARNLVRKALQIARSHGFLNMNWCPMLQVWLCEFAAENEIEMDYLRLKIRTLGIAPARPDVENWPWPVKICTFERLGIWVDGTRLAFSGKAPKKALDLLKALLSLGGQDVSLKALFELVWPDPSGDAQKSLEMAVARLRRSLGRSDALLVHEGKLSLNPDLVWVDAYAFERMLADDGGRTATGAERIDAAAEDRTGAAFRLYKGRFLEHEPQTPWMRATADRLHAKYRRMVLTLGSTMEENSADEAAALYARALELDNLDEELYRRLMLCHRARGEIAAAMSVYRRCRDNLSIVLGVAPSPETTAIFNSLRQ